MNVLILGLGSIARKHIVAFQELYPQDLTITALRSSLNSSKVPDVHSIYQLEELKERQDFVIISTPTINHKESIFKVLDLAIRLFIEKPILANLEGVERLKERIEKKNILTCVSCNLRFHEPLLKVKDILSQQTLGKSMR